LNLQGNQYGAAVSVVYSTYIFFEPLWAVLLRSLTPKYLVAAFTLVWAVITIVTAFVRDFSSLATTRVLLGAAEAAILPCITIYITKVYNRNEYAVRKAYLQISSAVSGSFGGLMAFGLTQINHGGLHGWQWMYIVEGILSLIMVPVTFLWVPNSAAEANFSNEEEKALIARRQLRNRGIYDEGEKYRWSEVMRIVKDWKVYVSAVILFAVDKTLYAVTTFMPKIIAGLGITTTVKSQLLTVPVYFVAGLSFYILAEMADHKKKTSTFIMIGLIFNAVGYILLITVLHPGGRLFGIFVLSMGLYSAASLNVVWCVTMHAAITRERSLVVLCNLWAMHRVLLLVSVG
jgi:MFS family permease